MKGSFSTAELQPLEDCPNPLARRLLAVQRAGPSLVKEVSGASRDGAAFAAFGVGAEHGKTEEAR